MTASSLRPWCALRYALLLGAALFLTTSCDRLTGSGEEPPNDPVAVVEGGSLRGRHVDGINVFLGIPYAEAPVRDLRWKPPRPPNPWTGVRSAQAFGVDCMQHQTPTDQPQSEDCLFLNIWAPAGRAEPLSVMVWIHGGGLSSGSAAVPIYDGAELARRGVVLVSLNYRLGRFGFFAHPVLTTDDTEGLLGNYGLMDQMAALLWIQRNIVAFGGNPADLTLFGESAGGRSVHALLTSSLSNGLFDKAIIQSGAGLAHMRPIRTPSRSGSPSVDGSVTDVTIDTTAEAMGVAFARSIGLDDPTAAELRAISGLLVRGPKGETPPVFPDTMIDGQILREDFDDAYRRGEQPPIPVIIGANSLEALHGDQPLVGDRALVRSLGDAEPEARALYDGYGTGNDDLIALEMEGDRRQVSRTRRHARLLAMSGAPVYQYHYSYVTDTRRERDPAARHGAEIGLVFNTNLGTQEPSAADTEMARLLASYWVHFAQTGDPNHDGNLHWPRYDTSTDEILEFTNLGTAATRSHYEADKLDFWDTLDASGWRYSPGQPAAGAADAVTPASSQTASSNPQ